MATQNTAAWETDPAVVPWPETRPFWEAAAKGKFLMPKCEACGKFHWHPRTVCPFCHANKIAWIESPGKGTVYSYSIARTWPDQHIIAFVQTAEGPVILTQVVDCPHDAIKIGMPVKVKLMQVEEGRTMPFFAPDK